MTSDVKYGKIKLAGIRSILLSGVLTAAVFMAAIYLADDLGNYVEDSLILSVKVIIPSIFPFLILTDLISPYLHFEKIKPLSRLFEKLFKINGSAIPIFVCGVLCGFPIGAKMAYDAYRRGSLSRDECERLMAFSNNAGPSYVISVVGIAVRGSLNDGIILYISMILGSIATGIVIGLHKEKWSLSVFNIEQKYHFTDVVKSSALVSLNVCAFISTFGIFVGLIKRIVKNDAVNAIIIPFLEIGNAAVYLANGSNLSHTFSLAMTSFAISFSGLSVIFQTLSIQEKSDKIDTKLYVTRKLIQGLISAACAVMIFTVAG